jgi:hypothetical protein
MKEPLMLQPLEDGSYSGKDPRGISDGLWQIGMQRLTLELRNLRSVQGFMLGLQPQLADANQAALEEVLTTNWGLRPSRNYATVSDAILAVGQLGPRDHLLLINPTTDETSAFRQVQIRISPVAGWSSIADDDPRKWQSLIGEWGHTEGYKGFKTWEPELWIDVSAPEILFGPPWKTVFQRLPCENATVIVSVEAYRFKPADPDDRAYAFERGFRRRAAILEFHLSSHLTLTVANEREDDAAS